MNFNVPVPIYLEPEFQEIKEMSSDGEKLEATWQLWSEGNLRRTGQLKSMGLNIIEVAIHPLELKDYCETYKLEINGEARAKLAKSISEQK